jgi:hypothetical protein
LAAEGDLQPEARIAGASTRMEAHVPHAPVAPRSHADHGRTAAAPAAPAAPPGGPPLLVALDGLADLDTSLPEAAGRARATGRALLVAIVEPPGPLTVDPVVHARHALLRAELHAALAATVRRRCADLDVEVLRLRRPRALTRRGARDGLQRRLTALARSRGAELHRSSAGAAARPATDVVR